MTISVGEAAVGRFCWVDLAASDADGAKAFYGGLFGWSAVEQPANGGSFTRLVHCGRDIGSMYRLRRAQLERGVPSHWTPYVRVPSADHAAARAAALGGGTIVRPFDVSGMARIALIRDPAGALFGLWQPLEAAEESDLG